MPTEQTFRHETTAARRFVGTAVLVTGATGFIGTRLAERLAQEGAAVTGVGRNPDRLRHLREQGIQVKSVDLRDAWALARAVDGHEIVVHAGAVLGGAPDVAQAVNVDATDMLVRMAGEVGVRRFVHVSTVGVYDMSNGPVIHERIPLAVDHSSVYPRTKAQAERRAVARAEETGLELSIVRPTMVYGPGPGLWTVQMVENVRAGRPVFLGDGSAHFHPVYVDDVVDAILRCATMRNAEGEAFNVAAEATTWKTFMSHYGSLCDREVRGLPVWGARLMAAANWIPGVQTGIDRGAIEMATSRNEFPTEKVRRLLGWEPRVSLEDGMERTGEWLKRHDILS